MKHIISFDVNKRKRVSVYRDVKINQYIILIETRLFFFIPLSRWKTVKEMTKELQHAYRWEDNLAIRPWRFRSVAVRAANDVAERLIREEAV